MDLSGILNAAISLMFLFLVLSMLATTIEELAAGWWNTRGRGLKMAIGNLLGDPGFTRLAKQFYEHKLIAGLTPPGMHVPRLAWLRPVLPLLAARLPSYIHKETFADALIDILRRDGPIQGASMQAGLAALWRLAGQDETAFRAKLMDWYAAATDRQSGRYKRGAQRWLFAYGLVLAAVLNIDTIAVTRFLLKHGNASAVADLATRASEYHRTLAAGSQAQGTVQQPGADTEKALAPPSLDKAMETLALVQGLPLPIGWPATDACTVARGAAPWAFSQRPLSWLGRRLCPSAEVKAAPQAVQPVGVAQLLGWIFTALAVSLGAQFWFDTLGRVIGLRSSGARPGGNAPAPAPATPK